MRYLEARSVELEPSKYLEGDHLRAYKVLKGLGVSGFNSDRYRKWVYDSTMAELARNVG